MVENNLMLNKRSRRVLTRRLLKRKVELPANYEPQPPYLAAGLYLQQVHPIG